MKFSIKKISISIMTLIVIFCFLSLGTFKHLYAQGTGGGASLSTYTNFASEKDIMLPCLCDWEEGEIKFILYHSTIPQQDSLTLVYNLLESNVKQNYDAPFGTFFLGQYSSQTDTCNFGIAEYCVELTGQKWPTWTDRSTGIGTS